jgi:hypothetical protein
MSNNLSTITIPDDCCAALLDAVQRAVTDPWAQRLSKRGGSRVDFVRCYRFTWSR